MRCPFCNSDEIKVIDSRETPDLSETRRRRECLKCEKRFTTYERVEGADVVLIKKDGSRENFSRGKGSIIYTNIGNNTFPISTHHSSKTY